MQHELSLWPNKETGGVLLGYFQNETISVIEAIDGGYTENCLREEGRFSYDPKYVEHVSSWVSNMYSPSLELVGIWHKHNHTDEPCFSVEDIDMHDALVRIVGRHACSILFQKKDCSGEYIMRCFSIESNGQYNETDQVMLLSHF